MGEEWCTIESDPGVFTELCEDIGVKGVQFEEVYTLDEESFKALAEGGAVHGLIFLFKWRKENDDRPIQDFPDRDLFYAQQVIPNACATQAILSVLLNQPGLEVGQTLNEFKEFTQGLDSQMKGLAIGNSESIRKAHNTFHRQSSFEIVQEKDSSDDAFHFIGYVQHKGNLYELDGLKGGPILLGAAGDDWLQSLRPEIQKRIDMYQQVDGAEAEKVELRFNLMAIVANKQQVAEKAIEFQRHKRQRANIKLVSLGDDVELADEVDDDEAPEGVPAFDELPDDLDVLKGMVAACTSEIQKRQAEVEAEKIRRSMWQKENARRRHDFVPLALCALKHLAKKRKLMPAFKKAREVVVKKKEEAEKKKKEEEEKKKTEAA